MKKYNLYIGFRLLGKFDTIQEAKLFAKNFNEDSQSIVFNLLSSDKTYRYSWFRDTKSKNIT